MILKTITKKGSNLIYKILLLHKYTKARYEKIIFQKSELLLTVVAFNNADLIKLQYEKLNEFLNEPFDYLVIDNSSKKETSEQLRAFCKEKNISYVLLPKNPLTGIRASGSHGIALNWFYKNIIQKYQPTYFGLLDHDLFPLKEVSVRENLTTDFSGIVRRRKENFWYLWPGFSFFKYEKMKKFSVNFFPHHSGKDGSIFLDTGGANYHSIYKQAGKYSIKEITSKLINKNTGKEFIKGEDSSQVFEIIDNSWLHLRQIAWRAESSNKINEVGEITSFAKKFLP